MSWTGRSRDGSGPKIELREFKRIAKLFLTAASAGSPHSHSGTDVAQFFMDRLKNSNRLANEEDDGTTDDQNEYINYQQN